MTTEHFILPNHGPWLRCLHWNRLRLFSCHGCPVVSFAHLIMAKHTLALVTVQQLGVHYNRTWSYWLASQLMRLNGPGVMQLCMRKKYDHGNWL